jgi:hypothetical protein
MQYHIKRPIYQAIRFDGTSEAAEKIRDMTGIFEYTITAGPGTSKLEFVLDKTPYSVTWDNIVVKDPDGGVSVMSWGDFRHQFERVPE